MTELKYYRRMLLKGLFHAINQTVNYFRSMTSFGTTCSFKSEASLSPRCFHWPTSASRQSILGGQSRLSRQSGLSYRQ
jgi:hypothetical protein